MPLAQIPQEDFSAGMVRAIARHLIPDNGAFDIVNGLLDDDGSVYKRGGSEYKSDADFSTDGLRVLWDGYLAGGLRTVFADSDAWGVLDVDDESPISLGGSGSALPLRGYELNGLLWFSDGTIYGGSRMAADYSTGTVTVTAGSATVTGVGTAFLTNVDAGMLLRVSGAGRYYAVKSVDSDTILQLTEEVVDAAAGAAYVLSRLGSRAAAPYVVGSVITVVGRRLIVCVGNRAYMSAYGDPHSSNADEDFHEVTQGAEIVGAEGLGDTLLLFTTRGVWAAANVSLETVDFEGNQQQPLREITRDLVLWGQEGVATWQGRLVVPATDAVWLVDGISSPAALSGSIATLYRDYVRLGHRPGGPEVVNGHYLLPVLTSAGVWVDTLVCRLDRPVSSRIGTIYPWTHLAGSGAEVAQFAVRTQSGANRQQQLLGAGRAASSRVLSLNSYFAPAADVKQDADGTTHRWTVDTRDYATGRGNRNLARRLRARDELADAGSDDPTIQGYYSKGVIQGDVALFGTAVFGVDRFASASAAEYVLMAGQAPEDDGRDPYTWRFQAKSAFVRFRLTSSDPTAKLVLREIELFIRESARIN